MLRGTAVYTGTTLFEEPSDSSTQRGCCVIHMVCSASPSASTDSLFLATTQSISEQQTHS